MCGCVAVSRVAIFKLCMLCATEREMKCAALTLQVATLAEINVQSFLLFFQLYFHTNIDMTYMIAELDMIIVVLSELENYINWFKYYVNVPSFEEYV